MTHQLPPQAKTPGCSELSQENRLVEQSFSLETSPRHQFELDRLQTVPSESQNQG